MSRTYFDGRASAHNTSEVHELRFGLQAAREIQCRLMPHHLPRVDGLDYYGECRPARELGGDFYDFIPRQESLIVSLGDVSGHGIGSAMIMSSLQTSLRSLSERECGGVSGVIERLNRIIYEITPDNVYPTLFYGRIDPLRRRLEYVSAGHEPALLVRKHAVRVDRLESTCTVLGFSVRPTYKYRTVALEPGDLMVLFTDGITEAVDGNGRELWDTGVLQIVRDHIDARATDLVGEIMEAVDRFTEHAVQTDDRTVVVVRLAETAEHAFVGQASCWAQAAA